MATVSHYEYTMFDGMPFNPGEVRSLTQGPWPWAVKGIVVTAHPFDLSTAFRALQVTDLTLRTTPAQPVGDKWLDYTVSNVGSDPIVIYYIALDVVGP